MRLLQLSHSGFVKLTLSIKHKRASLLSSSSSCVSNLPIKIYVAKTYLKEKPTETLDDGKFETKLAKRTMGSNMKFFLT